MANQFGARTSPISTTDAQNTSLHRLHHVEKRIIHVLELAGGVMEELANGTGPRMEMLNSYCREFMQSIKDIQVTLREEIKSACEYRPFENCDYNSRVSNEICCKKLDYIIEQLDGCQTLRRDAFASEGVAAATESLGVPLDRALNNENLWYDRALLYALIP